MCAVFPLLYTGIAVAPGTFETNAAVPITRICKFRAPFAKEAFLKPWGGTIVLSGLIWVPVSLPVSSSSEDVR